MKLPAFQKRERMTGTRIYGNFLYMLFKKSIFTSFHNYQERFMFIYTFLVDEFYYYRVLPWDGNFMWEWVFATITYLGTLNLPRRANTKVINPDKI